MLRFLTAGESHGPCLVTIVEGLPAGLPVDEEFIQQELRRRQGGYGRGGRMVLEQDTAKILSGVWEGRTTGAPVALSIANRDVRKPPPLTVPRPGHADYAGAVKYGLADARPVAERASARETAARVAAGALAKLLLRGFGIAVGSYVVQIGPVVAQLPDLPEEERWALAETDPVRCPDPVASVGMRAAIDAAREEGDTLGGVFVVSAIGLPVGLGSHVHWDRRLDARLAAAVMSIPAVKGVEIGPAFANAALPGSKVHDEFAWPEDSSPPGRNLPPILARRSNHAGGIEGGITNGQPLLLRAAMKPIPTTRKPLHSLDLASGRPALSPYERSDVCAVPAAAVVGEAMVAWVLAQALLERFGADVIPTRSRQEV